MKLSPGAQLVWDAIEAAAQQDGTIWTDALLVVLSQLNLGRCATAFVLSQGTFNGVWREQLRKQVAEGRRPGPMNGTARADLYRTAERIAKDAQDQQLAEWHLASAVAELLDGPNGIRMYGIDRATFPAEVRAREEENQALGARKLRPDWGDRWHRERPLTEGGQGRIWIVTDIRSPGPDFVLKELKNLKRRDLFKTEIDAIQLVDHANVVRLLDFNADAERPYQVLPYYPKGNLVDYRGTGLTLTSLLRMFLGIAQGVAAAHAAGVVHRDIKPENVLVNDEGRPIVADFGIAFIDDPERERFTATFDVMGPRWFIAPELENGRLEDMTPASDVYSLGKLLHWLIVGEPFAREYLETEDRNVARIVGAGHGEHINRLLRRMIVEDRGQRVQSAVELVPAVIHLATLVEGGFNAVSPNVPAHCLYCGEGVYLAQLPGGYDHRLGNWGMNPNGQPDWRMMVCNACGNVQAFRLDLTNQNKGWWG